MTTLRDVLARLPEIKALAEKATPGPWSVEPTFAEDIEGTTCKLGHWIAGPQDGDQVADPSDACVLLSEDAALIVTARNEPWVAALEQARELLERLATVAAKEHESEWMGRQGMLCKPKCKTCAAIAAAEEALGR